MSGIRVSGLAASVTDKHLRVYFSNPRNGGGHVQKLFYPLPQGSAVLLFTDNKVTQDVTKRTHQLSGQAVEVSVLPKAVFRRAVVEVEKNVSAFLSVNPQLVDELQFIGELNVTYKYGKESYLLVGSWYQLEWALHYLDTMLDAFGFDIEEEFEQRGAVEHTQKTSESAKLRQPTEFRQQNPSDGQQIKHPNTPVMRRPQLDKQSDKQPDKQSDKQPDKQSDKQPDKQSDKQPVSLAAMTRPKISNIKDVSVQQFRETDSLLTRPTKNKNTMPTTGATWNNGEPRSIHGNQGQYHATSRRETGQANHRVQCSSDDGGEDDDDDDFNTGHNIGAMSSFKDRSGRLDSYSENEASMSAGYNGRSKKDVPQLTRGIDVSKTYFGEGPLSFTFELAGNIKVHVAMDDITMQTTDTIINPTTPDLSNVYGISRAIMSAVGYEMQIACRRYVEDNGLLQYADVMHTAAGGHLSKNIGFVLHTAGPAWREDESEPCTHMLVCTYINCFQYADQKLLLQSLATPLISAGAFGFPLDVCIGAFYDALLLFSTAISTKRHLKEIHLVCFDQDSAMATIMIIQSLLDCDGAQSAVAASDRYWMRSSAYNFQAQNFRPSGDENTGGENTDGENTGGASARSVDVSLCDEKKEKLGTADRQVNSRQDRDKDNNRQSDIEEQTEEKLGKLLDKQVTETEHMNKHEQSNLIWDSDNEEKELNLYVDVNLAQEQPGKIAIRKSSSEKMYMRNADEDSKNNTAEEGNTDCENIGIVDEYLQSSPKLSDAHVVDYRSMEEEDADKGERNSDITDDVPNKNLQSSPKLGDAHVVDYRSTDEEDADKGERNSDITDDVPNKNLQSSPKLGDAHVIDYRSTDEEDADKDDGKSGFTDEVPNKYLQSSLKLSDAHVVDYGSTEEEDAYKGEGNSGITDEVPNEYLQSSPKLSDAHVVDYGSTEEEDAFKDDGNSGFTDEVPNKYLQLSPKLSDAHVVDYRSTEEEDADKYYDCEEKDPDKLPHDALNYASHGRSNMADECERSSVPGNDVSTDTDRSKENESGDEAEEELFL